MFLDFLKAQVKPATALVLKQIQIVKADTNIGYIQKVLSVQGKNKANEIYQALKQKGADRDDIGNAATSPVLNF